MPHNIWTKFENFGQCPVVIVPGGPSQVREILIYSWQYFEMLPGAKALLQDFLGTENPKYSTRFKVALTTLLDNSELNEAFF